MQTATILGPVFLAILLGAILRRSGFLPGRTPRTLSRYCYWIALPPLLFLKIGLAEASMAAAGSTFAVCSAVTIALALAGLLAGLVMRLSPTGIATVMHVAMRGNLAYVALPVVIFAFKNHPQSSHAEAIAALVIGPLVILYNLVPSIVHVVAAHGGGKGLKRKVLGKLVSNPLILACLVGLLWNRFGAGQGVGLPLILYRSFDLVAQSALPLALLCVGCSLADTRSVHAALPCSVAALLKNLAGILLAIVFARWLNADAVETAVAILFMAAPTAVASFVMTEELGGDPDIASGTITLSTLLSLLSLPLALAWAL